MSNYYIDYVVHIVCEVDVIANSLVLYLPFCSTLNKNFFSLFFSVFRQFKKKYKAVLLEAYKTRVVYYMYCNSTVPAKSGHLRFRCESGPRGRWLPDTWDTNMAKRVVGTLQKWPAKAGGRYNFFLTIL